MIAPGRDFDRKVMKVLWTLLLSALTVEIGVGIAILLDRGGVL